VPNLLDAVGRFYDSGDVAALRIARELSCADCTDTIETSFEESVLSTFGIRGEGQIPPTLAGLTASLDLDLDHVPTEWLRADPVYLLADRNGLILFDSETVGLEENEADCLIELLNDGLAADGITLKRGISASRWYVSMSNVGTTWSHSPRALSGQAIEPHSGDLRQSVELKRLMTSVQMLLHQSPVNAYRESEEKRPVNSVWLWGFGTLPLQTDKELSMVIGSDDLVAAGARFCGIEYRREVPTKEFGFFEGGGSLAIVDDSEFPQSELARFEREIFCPAKLSLREGRYEVLRVITRDRTFVLTDLRRWQFWRRLRSPNSILKNRRHEMHQSNLLT